MNEFTDFIGKILYWLSWPAVTLYINGSQRTRLLLVCDDKALVVKGWISDGRWSLPGGGLHKNEDTTHGVIREVGEETSLRLKPKDIKYIGVLPFRDQGFRFECHYFYAVIDQPLAATARLEIKEVRWMKLTDLNSYTAAQDVLQAIALVRHN